VRSAKHVGEESTLHDGGDRCYNSEQACDARGVAACGIHRARVHGGEVVVSSVPDENAERQAAHRRNHDTLTVIE